ncbi:MAG: helix-turn-helix domain-containing protein [Planctomycetia bacterium]|nr:helix-turn-helix domain-containing protein [Planctomycetia bacterium]
MIRFDDFDAWGDAISGASLRLTCDAVEQRAWTLGTVDLGSVVLQIGWEGGGTLCYGANTHPGTILFVPLTHASEHVANGERLDNDSFLAIPSGADFRIAVRKRAHAWCSIALPDDAAATLQPTPASARIACGPGLVPRVRRLATEIAAAMLDRSGGSAAHLTAGRTLAEAAMACLPAQQAPPVPIGRPRFDRGEIVRRAMAAIDGQAMLPTAADLARDVGVTSRTLLRTFQETFGVPPRQYLILRELHAVRRSLRTAAGADVTVANVLARHGIWEFGRFAVRYRRHFGESPSVTLSRVRG